MRILFVYSVDDVALPDKPLCTPEQMQFGISYISSVLKQHGFETDLVVLSRILGARNARTVDESIKQSRPDMICLTAVSSEYRFIRRIAEHIKKHNPGILLSIGGSYVSLNPDGILGEAFDVLCVGEGEYPLLELANQLKAGKRPSNIPNMWIKKEDGEIEKNATRPFLKDIDSLPFPDRAMWRKWTEDAPEAWEPILLGRGCPFQCTYCCNHALRKIAQGSYVRLRSPENIIKEISEITAASPQKKRFYLEVETIGANMSWARSLCSGLQSLNNSLKEPLSFGTNLRITRNADLEELFIAFKSANFKFVKIGVESGSERVRRDILKRDYSNLDIANTVKLARKYGMAISFYNLIGVPGETFEDFKETLGINRECLPDQAFAHVFFPYPGTELYAVCAREGLLKKAPTGELERCRAVLDLPGFSKGRIRQAFIRFDYNVYKGHRPMIGLLAKTLVSTCRSNTLLHYLYRHATYSPLFRRIKSALKATSSR